ncbi:MAG: hypothetical protein IKJ18_03210 [Bacteroidaceae bacterium]|nr:hypothetical protein [Bacteroidaceae bacterium]
MKKQLSIMFIIEQISPDKLQKFEEELLQTGLLSYEDGKFLYEESNEELVLNTMERIFIPNFKYKQQ